MKVAWMGGSEARKRVMIGKTISHYPIVECNTMRQEWNVRRLG